MLRRTIARVQQHHNHNHQQHFQPHATRGRSASQHQHQHQHNHGSNNGSAGGNAPYRNQNQRSSGGGSGFNSHGSGKHSDRNDFVSQASLLKRKFRGKGQYEFARKEAQEFLSREVPGTAANVWMEHGLNAVALAQLTNFFEIEPDTYLVALMTNKLARIMEDPSVDAQFRLQAASSIMQMPEQRQEDHLGRIFSTIESILRSPEAASDWFVLEHSAKVLQRAGKRTPTALIETLSSAITAKTQNTPLEDMNRAQSPLLRSYAWLVRSGRFNEANQVLFALIEHSGRFHSYDFGTLLMSCLRHNLVEPLPIGLIHRLARVSLTYSLVANGHDLGSILGSMAKMITGATVGVNDVTQHDLAELNGRMGAILEEYETRLLRFMNKSDALFWTDYSDITTAVFAYEIGGKQRYHNVFVAFARYVEECASEFEPPQLAMAAGILRRANLITPSVASLLSDRIESVLGEFTLAEISHVCATFAGQSMQPSWIPEAKAVAARLLDPASPSYTRLTLALAFPSDESMHTPINLMELTPRQLCDSLPLAAGTRFEQAIKNEVSRQLQEVKGRFGPDDLAYLQAYGDVEISRGVHRYLSARLAEEEWSADTLYSLPLIRSTNNANGSAQSTSAIPTITLTPRDAQKALEATKAAAISPEQYVSLVELLSNVFGESDDGIVAFAVNGGIDLLTAEKVQIRTIVRYLSAIAAFPRMHPSVDWLVQFNEGMLRFVKDISEENLAAFTSALRAIFTDVERTPVLDKILTEIVEKHLSTMHNSTPNAARIIISLAALQRGFAVPFITDATPLVATLKVDATLPQSLREELAKATSIAPMSAAAAAAQQQDIQFQQHMQANDGGGSGGRFTMRMRHHRHTTPQQHAAPNTTTAPPPPPPPPVSMDPLENTIDDPFANTTGETTTTAAPPTPTPTPTPAQQPSMTAVEEGGDAPRGGEWNSNEQNRATTATSQQESFQQQQQQPPQPPNRKHSYGFFSSAVGSFFGISDSRSGGGSAAAARETAANNNTSRNIYANDNASSVYGNNNNNNSNNYYNSNATTQSFESPSSISAATTATSTTDSFSGYNQQQQTQQSVQSTTPPTATTVTGNNTTASPYSSMEDTQNGNNNTNNNTQESGGGGGGGVEETPASAPAQEQSILTPAQQEHQQSLHSPEYIDPGAFESSPLSFSAPRTVSRPRRASITRGGSGGSGGGGGGIGGGQVDEGEPHHSSSAFGSQSHVAAAATPSAADSHGNAEPSSSSSFGEEPTRRFGMRNADNAAGNNHAASSDGNRQTLHSQQQQQNSRQGPLQPPVGLHKSAMNYASVFAAAQGDGVLRGNDVYTGSQLQQQQEQQQQQQQQTPTQSWSNTQQQQQQQNSGSTPYPNNNNNNSNNNNNPFASSSFTTPRSFAFGSGAGGGYGSGGNRTQQSSYNNNNNSIGNGASSFSHRSPMESTSSSAHTSNPGMTGNMSPTSASAAAAAGSSMNGNPFSNTMTNSTGNSIGGGAGGDAGANPRSYIANGNSRMPRITKGVITKTGSLGSKGNESASVGGTPASPLGNLSASQTPSPSSFQSGYGTSNRPTAAATSPPSSSSMYGSSPSPQTNSATSNTTPNSATAGNTLPRSYNTHQHEVRRAVRGGKIYDNSLSPTVQALRKELGLNPTGKTKKGAGGGIGGANSVVPAASSGSGGRRRGAPKGTAATTGGASGGKGGKQAAAAATGTAKNKRGSASSTAAATAAAASTTTTAAAKKGRGKGGASSAASANASHTTNTGGRGRGGKAANTPAASKASKATTAKKRGGGGAASSGGNSNNHNSNSGGGGSSKAKAQRKKPAAPAAANNNSNKKKAGGSAGGVGGGASKGAAANKKKPAAANSKASASSKAAATKSAAAAKNKKKK